MKTNRFHYCAAALLSLAWLLAPAHAQGSRKHNLNIDTEGNAERCSDLKIRSSGEIAQSAEAFTLQKSEAPVLELTGMERSVLKVRGWERAEYSVDAGDWQYLEPTGRISDTRTENYNFSLPEPGTQNSNAHEAPTAKANKPGTKAIGDPPSPTPTEHLIVVRVWDRFDNMATAKTVIRTK